MKLYIASDHAGFKFKKKLCARLRLEEIPFEDLGPSEFKDGDDYSDYAFKVGERVVKDKGKGSEGVLICGSGAGMCIAANKVKGVRAVAASDIYEAISAKADDDCNVICLRSRRTTFLTISKILSAWMKAKFKNKDPYLRRVKKIEAYEK